MGGFRRFGVVATVILAWGPRAEGAGDSSFCQSAAHAVCSETNARQAVESVTAFNREIVFETRRTDTSLEKRIWIFEGLAYRRLGLSRNQLESFFERQRADFLEALERNPALTRSDAAAMRKTLSRVKFVTAGEYSAAGGSAEQGEVIRHCRSDGSALNAFVDPEFHAIVVCPGSISLLGSAFGVSARFERMVLHELGHFVNTDFFPSAFRSFEACVREQDDLDPTMLSEVSADYLSVEVLVLRLSRADISESGVTSELALGFSGLCNTLWGDSHPSGAYRISRTLGEHPAIRELAGCADEEPRLSCTLGGSTSP